MTAKEALLQRVQSLTEEEAEALLRELPPVSTMEEPPRESLYDIIAGLWADVPDEELQRLGASDNVGAVLRLHAR